MVVAALGIAVNLGAAWLLRDGHAHDLNRRGAFLHLIADAAVSLAAVLAGAGMLVLRLALARSGDSRCWSAWWSRVGAFGLLRDSFNAAMDAVPASIDQRARCRTSSPRSPASRPCTTCTSGRWARARSR